uniref:Uncharacterized protein n=1 Tax=Rhizophora mucronata TaxID=61149 RepID=A0A2P2P2U7_RHIMU
MTKMPNHFDSVNCKMVHSSKAREKWEKNAAPQVHIILAQMKEETCAAFFFPFWGRGEGC